MTDQMVLATQKWLNKTYVGRNGYNVVQENGRTGWEVVHGLLRALQIELGISVPSDNFGPGTTARYQAAPLAKPALKGATSNKYAILQGALWCKGYDAGHYGDLDDHYDDKVAAAVASLQADAGIGGRRLDRQREPDEGAPVDGPVQAHPGLGRRCQLPFVPAGAQRRLRGLLRADPVRRHL